MLIACCCWMMASGFGCARRIDLTPQEFERWHREDPDLNDLRVYPSRRLLSFYPQLGDDVTRDVKDRKVIERGEKQRHRRLVTRSTSGKIVAIDELNGMPRFWVTFYADCAAPECAYGFVQTELHRYSLVSVPQLEGFQPPISYRRNRLKRNKIRLLRQRSLAETNEVLAAPRSGKALPIDLQLRKDSWRPTRTTWEKAPGV
ncbi:hypothetical protein OV079_47575 [Nannocystis pusilla]|uniref:Uncharacterized protein n=1 Tax=Nannocystis pusilla TaxID=889268 RepID=A0A9X3F7V6_9BACT|nr:hypothetical protein [Nannocystis pusilla]MCY1013071.1 hypothetical protein [Nannocystis pusilla]